MLSQAIISTFKRNTNFYYGRISHLDTYLKSAIHKLLLETFYVAGVSVENIVNDQYFKVIQSVFVRVNIMALITYYYF